MTEARRAPRDHRVRLDHVDSTAWLDHLVCVDPPGSLEIPDRRATRVRGGQPARWEIPELLDLQVRVDLWVRLVTGVRWAHPETLEALVALDLGAIRVSLGRSDPQAGLEILEVLDSLVIQATKA